jgi:HAD superfamily hydrolase (TIGR01549 family)
MIKAILFDLDDTLLVNSMEAFVPAYFQALARYMAHLVAPERLITELLRATRVMEAKDGNGPTNEEAFDAVFYPALGYEKAALQPIFEKFYAEEFPKLQAMTRPVPEARPLVEWAFAHGLQVVIATNPFFPRTAIEQRLAWAGVPVSEFDYMLVTSYEIMHATKSSPAYYREIVERLGRRPHECLMVGDDWKLDMLPAASAGLLIYWITHDNDVPPSIPPGTTLIGQGTPGNLLARLSRGELAL